VKRHDAQTAEANAGNRSSRAACGQAADQRWFPLAKDRITFPGSAPMATRVRLRQSGQPLAAGPPLLACEQAGADLNHARQQIE
jgi:hypothetical protein